MNEPHPNEQVEIRQRLQMLAEAPRFRFSDWANTGVPNRVPGVYAIWRDEELLYIGVAGRGAVPLDVDRKRSWGLLDRLKAHASGARSGDQFCVYVFDRLVLPNLDQDEIRAAADGLLRLDKLVRDYIRSHLSYSFLITNTYAEAQSLEAVVRRNGLAGAPPVLNPHRQLPDGDVSTTAPTGPPHPAVIRGDGAPRSAATVSPMTTLNEVAMLLRDFNAEHDWDQFHRPKNLAMALAGEVGELLAELQWLTDQEIHQQLVDSPLRQRLEEELADVFLYLVRLADICTVDLTSAALDKIELNRQRYPADLARGKSDK